MAGSRKNQGFANPLGVTGFDVENPVRLPIATKLKSEPEHADSEAVAGEPMSILTFLKIVSILDGRGKLCFISG